MKILQVTNFFKPACDSGGVTRVAYEISKGMVGRSNEVTVYTTDSFKSRLNVTKNKSVYFDGMNIYYFKNFLCYLSKNNITTPYYLPFIARKNIKYFDIIHIHEHRTLLAIIVIYYANKYNIPYVVQAHGSLPNVVKWKKLKNTFDLLFGKRILKNASRLFALNDTEAKQYISFGANPNKIEIVPNGIDESKYNNLPPIGSFKTKYNLENSTIILYVGRLHVSKGIDLLIESFADLSEELDNIKLVIIGPDNGYLDYFSQLVSRYSIKEKVIFTGFVSASDKISAFVDADIFVTPCFSGFPITFLESCICSTPIVTTTEGDNLGWIDNKVGFVVPYDIHALKRAMYDILTSYEIKSVFEKNCIETVHKYFTLSKVVDHIEDIYREVLNEV